jgi:hypothetical protein
MSFRIVVRRGNDRYVEDVQQHGKPMHEQRRAIKMHLGMLRQG